MGGEAVCRKEELEKWERGGHGDLRFTICELEFWFGRNWGVISSPASKNLVPVPIFLFL